MPVFISYSHSDKKFVDKLCRNLSDQQYHIWMDRWELKPGDSLIDSIQTSLGNAGAVIVVLSESYIQSEWCKKEWTSTLIRELEGAGNLIIPVRLDDSNIPLFLKDKLYADFRNDFDEAFRYLCEGLAKYTNLKMGRLTDSPEFNVDYSSDQSMIDENRIRIRYRFVEHAIDRPFSILSTIYLDLDEKWTRLYIDRVNNNLEHIVRGALSLLLIKFLSDEDIVIDLQDPDPVYGTMPIYDTSNEMMLDMTWEVNWLGEDTGKTIRYYLSKTLTGALTDYLHRIRSESLG